MFKNICFSISSHLYYYDIIYMAACASADWLTAAHTFCSAALLYGLAVVYTLHVMKVKNTVYSVSTKMQ